MINTATKNRFNKKLIMVCSGSKGVGKTCVSVVLSHCLSLLKKKVLLFDCNGGLENVGWQLGFEKTVSFAELLNGAVTLNNAVATYSRGMFDIITAPGGEDVLFSAADGRLQLLAQDLRCLADYYDCVIIDGGCDNEHVESLFLQQSEHVILLTNPDSSALVEAHKKLQKIQKLCNNPLGIIVNEARSDNEGRQVYKTLLKTAADLVGVETFLLGSICRDARIREAVSSRSLFLSRYPDCESAQEIKVIAQKVNKEWLDHV